METKEKKSKALISGTRYGAPINREVSEFIRKYTQTDNYADIAYKTGVSTSTIRDVLYRINSLTPTNEKAIVVAYRLALDTCKKKQNESISDYEKMKKNISNE